MCNYLLCEWDFLSRVFGEGDANRIADAIDQEGTYADRGFDTPIFSRARLCDPEVNFVVEGMRPKRFYESAIGKDHELDLARLEGDHHLSFEMEVATDLEELHGGVDHAFDPSAILLDNARCEGTMIDPDAYDDLLGSTDVDQCFACAASVSSFGVFRLR